VNLVRSSRLVRGQPAIGYCLGLLTFLLALVLRLSLGGTLPPGFPFLTFFPAVIVTAFVAGTRPAVLCAVLSGVAAWFHFIPPFNSFKLDGSTALALGFYVFIVTVDIVLLHFMTAATDRLRAERSVTAGLYEQQQTMFQELQHRVANNMTFVASLLHLQKRRVRDEPGTAADAFDEATRRIEIMSRVHRRLYDPASVERPIGQYFRELCSDLLETTGARNIVCLVDMPATRLDIAKLMTLSLLVTEVVTNSLKHAFTEEQAGTISLDLQRLDPDRLALTIRDNGCGLSEPTDVTQAILTGRGLGTRIVQGFAAQLGGELEVSGDNGMTTRVVFQA
jgi:two-component sensor histidine kinase